MHSPLEPSPWIRRWSALCRPGASVLDVACGSGRHVRWFTDRGCVVTGVDRDAAAAEPLRAVAQIVIADIEDGPWPLAGCHFDVVVVTNYLWRPRLPDIVAALAPGGTLIYETFAIGNETVGKPSRPDFLLRPGELLQVAQGLRVIAYEDGFLDGPARFVQRVAAVQTAGVSATPERFALDPAAAR